MTPVLELGAVGLAPSVEPEVVSVPLGASPDSVFFGGANTGLKGFLLFSLARRLR